jgi:cyclase
MLAKRIIPCLDIDRGRVVKGTKFLDLKDAGDAVECAIRYDREGADELVFLDITASSDNRNILTDLVRRVAESIFIPFTVGGGLRSVDDIRDILRAGADKVSLNTAAVLDPSLVGKSAKVFGNQCIVVAVDAKREGSGWAVYTHGGRKRTRLSAIDWIKRVEKLGAGEILLTSMDTDGERSGYDLDLLAAASDAVRIPVIASGGAGSPAHLVDALVRGRADAVLAASIFHYRKHSVRQVKRFLRSRGVCVRL